VDRIKERIDIAEVIGSYIDLEQSGSNLRAICPFHNENTPSFFVSPDRGLYYCFGCGAKGDVFTFVQEFEGLDFYGALQMLARKAGVELKNNSKQTRQKRKRLFKVLEMATAAYVSNLQESQAAREYLHNREITDATIRNFRLGFAPDEWHWLESYLQKKGVSDEEMEAVGLIRQNDKGRYYDRFRGRVVFPISDTAGRVVGFSGRLIEDKEGPKYLNSPETDFFEKSSILYGYNRAKRSIRANDFCILVEGQIDLVLAHQAGFTNTAAVLGSSTTAHHLQLIQRMTDNLLLAFDADTAGRRSEADTATIALSLGMDVKAVDLPDGEDPADVIAEDTQQWRSAVSNAGHIIRHHLGFAREEADDQRNFFKQIRNDIIPLVAAIPDAIDRSHFIEVIQEESDIPEQSLQEELKKERNSQDIPSANREPTPASQQKETIDHADSISRKKKIIAKLGGIIRWQEEENESAIDVASAKDQIEDLLDIDITDDAYVPQEAALKAEVAYENTENLKDHVKELLIHLKIEHIRSQYLEAMQALHEREKIGDKEKQDELLKRCQQLSKKLEEKKELLQSY